MSGRSLEVVDGLERQVHVRRAVKLAKVRHNKLGRGQRLAERFLSKSTERSNSCETNKVEGFGHLDLRGNAAARVVAELGRVADAERVRACANVMRGKQSTSRQTKHLDGQRRRAVELHHALDLLCGR